MELVIFYWLTVAVFTAMIARSKNRDGFGWFILGFLFNLLALFAVGLMPKIEPRGQRGEHRNYDEKTCPACAETVKLEATVCRYCSHQFDLDADRNAAVQAMAVDDKASRKRSLIVVTSALGVLVLLGVASGFS